MMNGIILISMFKCLRMHSGDSKREVADAIFV